MLYYKKDNFNYKINIDKRRNKDYNITNIEIFTINEYREYKQKYSYTTGLSDVNEKSNTQKEFIENLKEILKEINKKNYIEKEKKLSEITIKAMIKSKFREKEAEEILKNLKFERGDNMFRVEEMFRREERRFRAEGKKEGKKEGKIEIIKNMLKEKEPINRIVLFSGMKKSEIEKIAKEVN